MNAKIVKIMPSMTFARSQRASIRETQITVLFFLVQPETLENESWKSYLVGDYLLCGIFLDCNSKEKEISLALEIQMSNSGDEVMIDFRHFSSKFEGIASKAVDVVGFKNLSQPYLNNL